MTAGARAAFVPHDLPDNWNNIDINSAHGGT